MRRLSARRGARWAQLQVLQLLARLVAQIRLGRELPADPWQDTLPEARRAGDE